MSSVDERRAQFETHAKRLAREIGFEHVEFVGKGAFKETYKVIDNDERAFALKLFDPAKCSLARSEREISAMRRCDSPLIGRLLDYGESFSEDGTRFFYSLEEFLDGGRLTDKIEGNTLPSDTVRSYGINLAEALEHLRQRNLVHRDIKPDNVMFREGSNVPVLVDFGIVRDLSESSLTLTWFPSGPGTAYFSAPEQLRNEKHLIGWRTDQFGVGVMLGICLTGSHPFASAGINHLQVIQSVADRRNCSEEYVSAIRANKMLWLKRMIEPWPARRFPTTETLIQAIRES